MINKSFFTFALLNFYLFAQVCFSQGYVSVKLRHVPDSLKVHLLQYHMGKPYVFDSLQLSPASTNGRFARSIAQKGMYGLVFNHQAPTAFTWTGEEEIEFSDTISAQMQYQLEVTGSQENTAYLSFQKQTRPLIQKVNSIRDMVKQMQDRGFKDKAFFQDQSLQIKQSQDSLELVKADNMAKHPDYLYVRMIKAESLPKMPDSLMTDLSSSDKLAANQWYRRHFWDHYDFQDTIYMQSGIFQRKLDQWYQMHGFRTDTLLDAVDQIMLKAGSNLTYRHFILSDLISRFEDPSLHEGDRAFVYVADRYFKQVGDGGTDPASFERIKYKADAFRPTLNGLLAPPIALKDTSGAVRELYSLDAKYTLVYFFSPMCDHCQKWTPTVFETALQYEPGGLKVYSVTLDQQPTVWKDYVSHRLPGWTCVHDSAQPHPLEKAYVYPALPALYLLDQEKKIITKRFKPEHLAEILGQVIKI